MPGSVLTTYGIALTQWLAGDHDAGDAHQPLLDGVGLQTLERELHVGFTALISTSNCLPLDLKLQAGSKCSSPVNHLTLAVTTGVPPTSARQ